MEKFIPYKGRTVSPGQRVKVYRNLHKDGAVYSIMDAKTRRVLGHSSTLVLNDCTFNVSQAGRERVLKEQKKNVHAFIIGNYEEYDENADETSGIFVEYNPYKNKTFESRWSGVSIYKANTVIVRYSYVLATI